ncbi:unnamed protein product, partial [Brenthis ino]
MTGQIWNCESLVRSFIDSLLVVRTLLILVNEAFAVSIRTRLSVSLSQELITQDPRPCSEYAIRIVSSAYIKLLIRRPSEETKCIPDAIVFDCD